VAGGGGGGGGGSSIALAACMTGADERGTKWMDAVLDVLLARSADEIESAVNEWTEPVNNYMYCDTAGEFGYRLVGLPRSLHSPLPLHQSCYVCHRGDEFRSGGTLEALVLAAPMLAPGCQYQAG
jgi:hypothetical protein